MPIKPDELQPDPDDELLDLGDPKKPAGKPKKVSPTGKRVFEAPEHEAETKEKELLEKKLGKLESKKYECTRCKDKFIFRLEDQKKSGCPSCEYMLPDVERLNDLERSEGSEEIDDGFVLPGFDNPAEETGDLFDDDLSGNQAEQDRSELEIAEQDLIDTPPVEGMAYFDVADELRGLDGTTTQCAKCKKTFTLHGGSAPVCPNPKCKAPSAKAERLNKLKKRFNDLRKKKGLPVDDGDPEEGDINDGEAETKLEPIGKNKYSYEAMDTTGGEIKDTIDADSEPEALAKIKKLGYSTTSITLIEEDGEPATLWGKTKKAFAGLFGGGKSKKKKNVKQEEVEEDGDDGPGDYDYEAMDTTGGEETGTIYARSKADADRKLRAKGIFVVSITKKKKVGGKPKPADEESDADATDDDEEESKPPKKPTPKKPAGGDFEIRLDDDGDAVVETNADEGDATNPLDMDDDDKDEEEPPKTPKTTPSPFDVDDADDGVDFEDTDPAEADDDDDEDDDAEETDEDEKEDKKPKKKSNKKDEAKERAAEDEENREIEQEVKEAKEKEKRTRKKVLTKNELKQTDDAAKQKVEKFKEKLSKEIKKTEKKIEEKEAEEITCSDCGTSFNLKSQRDGKCPECETLAPEKETFEKAEKKLAELKEDQYRIKLNEIAIVEEARTEAAKELTKEEKKEWKNKSIWGKAFASWWKLWGAWW